MGAVIVYPAIAALVVCAVPSWRHRVWLWMLSGWWGM